MSHGNYSGGGGSGGGSGGGKNDSNSLGVSNYNKSGQTNTLQKDQILIGANLEIHAPLVTFCDMKTEMKEYAFEQAEIAFRLMYKGEKRYFKDVAEFIKKGFDEKFKGSWHVTVGRNFGAYVSYETQNIILFWINSIGFLIFKYG